jgi:hypothetical protein
MNQNEYVLGYISIGNQTSPIVGTITTTSTTTSSNVTKQNPYVPLEIHVNRDEKVMVVKWVDGTENKVTCDSEDNFSEEIGFAMALTQKMFGGKREFKEKWWKIISRRINRHESKTLLPKRTLKKLESKTAKKK